MKRFLAAAGVALAVAAAGAMAGDVAELVKQLKSGDAEARRNAAKALGDGGAEARAAVPALTEALRDGDRYVRRFAAQALGEVGPEAKSAVPALNALLRAGSDKKEVLDAAAAALGKIGGGQVSVDTLAATLRDAKRDPAVRRQAAEALGQMGTGAKAAIPTLLAVLKPVRGPAAAGSGDVRVAAADALAEIATPADKNAVDALTALSTDRMLRRDRTLMQSVNNALRKIKAKKPPPDTTGESQG